MALSKPPFMAFLFLSMLVLQLVDSRSTVDDNLVTSSIGRSLLQAPKIDCGAACATRCSRNWKNKMCRKMCGICCSKCSCVPPGTSQDTRGLCPCYDAMRNPAGHPKCP
ncbi:peamaclein-like [Ananas comosus]|uniref:Peamaclein-like n=1 Tax=Ananas comosus TaxID=4615 RepID=A0A6P5H5G8_ANACO|nr:peamaclein-like [Ananas comosus]